MPLKNGRTSAALQQILVGSIIPPGTIQSFGGGTVPDGWLLCDGSTASRSIYSALFAAIGVAHGSGDGSTTFHLPDLRGRFLRGADDMGTGAAGRDPGGRTTSNAGGNADGLGSVQDSDNKSHTHAENVGTNSVVADAWVGAQGNGSSQTGVWSTTGWANATSNRVLTDSTGISESRPQNLAVEYIIKV